MKKSKLNIDLPYMCLLMIVKNESHIILETLEMLKEIIDYWVICDTGSTDNTKQLICDFFDKEKIPGELHEHAWKNFGHNRTLAFEAAAKKSKYVFVFDADDKIHGTLEIPKNMTCDSAYLKFGQLFTYERMQIFKNSLKWEYRGVLHEFPNCLSKKENQLKKIHLGGNYHVESRRLGSRNHDPQKYEKDAQVLIDAIENKVDPDLKPRYLFYLAQSYRDCQDYDNAIKYYTLRFQEKGWIQEMYYSCWQIGCCMEQKFDLDKILLTDPQQLPDVILEITKWYLKGYSILPERGETLSALGILMYKTAAYEKAFYYLRKVKDYRLPNNALFANESLYKFFCDFYLCLVTNKLKNFELSATYCNLFLQVYKEFPNDKLYFGDIRIVQKHNLLKQVYKNNLNNDLHDKFIFFANKDVFGYDIQHSPEKTLHELMETTIEKNQNNNQTNTKANAFNTLGYIKDLPDDYFAILLQQDEDEKNVINLENTCNLEKAGIYLLKQR